MVLILHSQSPASRFRTIFMNTSEFSVLLKNMYLIGDEMVKEQKLYRVPHQEMKTSVHRGEEEVVRFFVCGRRQA
jgi:hypothetical protein